MPTALEVQSLNHWITREVLPSPFFKVFFVCFVCKGICNSIFLQSFKVGNWLQTPGSLSPPCQG